MPYGIPIPEELDFMEELPEWPAQWANNEPVSSYYYVDGTHPNVQKIHNGTPDEPLDLIPSTLGAGTLCVVRNLYKRDAAGKTTIRVNGTDGEWIAGYNGKAFVDFGTGKDRAKFFFKAVFIGKYGIFDGLTNDPTRVLAWQVGSSTDDLSQDAHHIVIRNFKYTGDGISSGSAASVAGPSALNSNKANYIVIYNNEISGYGNINYGVGEDVDANGLMINGNSSDVWILHNHIYETSGAGMQLAPTNTVDLTKNIYIGGNHIHDIAQAGIGLKYPSNVVISQNKIERCLDKHNTPSKGIGFQYGPMNVWMLFNEINDCRFGIRGAGTNSSNRPSYGWPVYAIGNIIDGSSIDSSTSSYTLDHNSSYNNATAFASMGTYRFYAANNLVMNSDVAFTSPISSENYSIVNNIFLKSRYDTLFFGSSGFLAKVENNLIASDEISVRMANNNFYYGLDDMETIPSVRNNLEFSDEYLGSKTKTEIIADLKNLSTLVDGGLDIPEEFAQIYEDSFGIKLERGFDDKKIPQGAARDIGPWESGNVLMPVIPSAPSGFHISSSSKELIWELNSINEDSIEVYKNGELLVSLPSGSTSYEIPTILDESSTYQVHVINGTGVANSEIIKSRKMTFELTEDDITLNDATAYLLTREDSRLDSNDVSFQMPTASRPFSGAPFDKVSAFIDQTKVSNGYIYLSNLAIDDFISCEFIGDSKVVVVIVTNNSIQQSPIGVSCTFYVSLGDTIYTIVNDGGFQKFKIEFTVEESSQIKITCKDGYSEGMIGVGTIHTNTEPSEVIVDPDKTDFTYTVQSDGYTIDFINPLGEVGTWKFGENYTTTDVNPTYTFTNGKFLVEFTDANSQWITIDVNGTQDPEEPQVPVNFSHTIVDNVVTFDNGGITGVWDLGDGTVVEASNHTKEYKIGNYGVSFNGGSKEYINIKFDPSITPVGMETERVVAAGDNITASGDSTGSNSYRNNTDLQLASFKGPWTNALLTHTVNDYIVEDNLGVSGLTTTKMFSNNVIDSIIDSNATLVVLMLGIEDIIQGKLMSEIQFDYTSIVNSIVNTNKRILIIPVAYTNKDGLGDVSINQSVDVLNNFLATLESIDGVKVSSVNPEYNSEIVSDPLSVSKDGMNPNNRGGVLLGENPANTLNTYYPSSLIKDSEILGFTGNSGSYTAISGEQTIPDDWFGTYGKSWVAQHMFNNIETLKVVTSGAADAGASNRIRLKLNTLPKNLEEGWYVLEIKAQFENVDALTEFKLVAESDSSWGLSGISYTTPVSVKMFKSNVEYKFRTLKMHLGESDGISYVYVDAEQVVGDDVTMYLYEPKFYKIADIE